MNTLAISLQNYFTTFARTQRDMSVNTIASYRDTWRMLLKYLTTALRIPADAVDFDAVTAAHVTAFRTAPATVRDAVVPMRDAYEARWAAFLGELATDGELADGTPVGLSRLALFGAMNTTVEWFDADRGNLDELADTITHQFWNGVAA